MTVSAAGSSGRPTLKTQPIHTKRKPPFISKVSAGAPFPFPWPVQCLSSDPRANVQGQGVEQVERHTPTWRHTAPYHPGSLCDEKTRLRERNAPLQCEL